MSSKNYDRKCKICDEQYTNDLNAEYEWCKSCQTKYLGDSASGNEKIDDLIQEIQSKINDPNDIVFEWIPYDQFDGIEEISKGDIATVYSAIWNNGPLSYSYFKKELTRISEKKVALKCLHNNSQNNINELLSEIKTYSINNLNNILKIYGISQNLDTKNYIMVLHNEYFEKCCKKCGQLYTNIEFKWCNSCHVNYLNKNFTTHLSENKEIDNYIQEMQLKINNPRTIVFEWIPYNQFVEINEISKSGFTTVYFAKWKDGPLYYEYMVGWARELDKKVALKCLDNSQNLTSDFLNEVTTYSIDYFDNNFKIYGISQNPDTKDYIMVLQNEYCEKCVKCGKYVDAQHKWCKLCQMNHFKEDFMNWTSGNEVINGFIQEMQLKIDDLSDIIFEWIPFDQFYNVEQIVKNKVKDDVAAVYSAIWKDGPLIYSPIRKDLKRESDNKVAIKSYHNSKNNISEFLNEVKIYSTKYLNDILKIYGISQRPDTGDYMMVFPYKECEKCGNPNINDLKAKYEWCRLCQIKYFEENFTKWTSGNEKIDNLIQETQLKINDPSKIVFEWIPYDQLYKKGEISKSDFDMIYSAIWKDGPLCYYDREWIRKSDKKVALKYYHNIPVNTEFLNEVKAYLKMKFSFIINIYGISQDSDTKDYFIVLENVEGENFNDWINSSETDGSP
ncbi:hypothetical protein RirG_169100 [Rhizophagus irregularis DAOM 197198w]|uniref:Protein kinase domain-containing protein n=1 Tax=Rhizophagus irregularis (strain DAOM 197198w) TaxID=1432141 RepID=A0A015J4P6_RHIIW|nr:hypothetical protein RirG_169100 [Rhizophagus irregularis DAOM 197198w]